MSRLVDCVFFNGIMWLYFFFFKQKTAYEVRISDWSSDVCSSDLRDEHREAHPRVDRDHPACRDRRAEEGELEMLVGPAEIGVEDFLVGEQRNREHGHEDDTRGEAQPVLPAARLARLRRSSGLLRPSVLRQPRPGPA